MAIMTKGKQAPSSHWYTRDGGRAHSQPKASGPGEGGGVGDQHATTAQITLHAISAAAGVFPGDPNPPHNVAQVFFMAIPSCCARTSVWDAAGGYYADVIVDVSDVVERKLAALNCIKSQAYDGAYARKCTEVAESVFDVIAENPQEEHVAQ